MSLKMNDPNVSGIQLLSRTNNGRIILKHKRKIWSARQHRMRIEDLADGGRAMGTANFMKGKIVKHIAYTPTAKKWNNKNNCWLFTLLGFIQNQSLTFTSINPSMNWFVYPDKNNTGPRDQCPPLAKYWKHPNPNSGYPSLLNTPYNASANTLITRTSPFRVA